MKLLKVIGAFATAFIYAGILAFFYYNGGIEIAIIIGLAIFLTLFSEFLGDFKDYTREERKRQKEAEAIDAELGAYKKHFGIKEDNEK